jgi:hypothetical protein
MMKLNGWKRIGIIVSVIWILGAGAYTYDSEIDQASLPISRTYLSCDSAAKAPTSRDVLDQIAAGDAGGQPPLPRKATDSAPEPGTVPMPPGAISSDSLPVTPPPGYTVEVPVPPGGVLADSRDCHKQAEDSLTLAVKNARLDASLVALVPVPLGWGITYLVLFLVRWVKRGFTQPFPGG